MVLLIVLTLVKYWRESSKDSLFKKKFTVKGQNNTLRMEQSSVVGFFQKKKLFVFFIHLYIVFKNTNPHAI